jgi:hypothetical protein
LRKKRNIAPKLFECAGDTVKILTISLGEGENSVLILLYLIA